MAAVSDVRGEITAPQRRTLSEVKSDFTNFAEGDVLLVKITPCMENGKAALIGNLVNHIGYGLTELSCVAAKNLERVELMKKSILAKAFRDNWFYPT